ncbi:hypothetical protein GGD57_003246 [Rhizobium esperanzae]|uniref:Uncharacterized protein n=1 Tax=Rhizobium esperanzae TaxID=1967781 RepID=A0A7W6R4E1_9HYPH|nr:hypothetical protein [Rhizobium esperanzae]
MNPVPHPSNEPPSRIASALPAQSAAALKCFNTGLRLSPYPTRIMPHGQYYRKLFELSDGWIVFGEFADSRGRRKRKVFRRLESLDRFPAHIRTESLTAEPFIKNCSTLRGKLSELYNYLKILINTLRSTIQKLSNLSKTEREICDSYGQQCRRTSHPEVSQVCLTAALRPKTAAGALGPSLSTSPVKGPYKRSDNLRAGATPETRRIGKYWVDGLKPTAEVDPVRTFDEAAGPIAQLRDMRTRLRDGRRQIRLLLDGLGGFLNSLDGGDQASLDRSIGLKSWGSVSADRQEALKRRDDMLRRLYRETRGWMDLPSSAAVRMMRLDAERYETRRRPRDPEDFTPPPVEPARTWWKILTAGATIPGTKRLQCEAIRAEMRFAGAGLRELRNHMDHSSPRRARRSCVIGALGTDDDRRSAMAPDLPSCSARRTDGSLRRVSSVAVVRICRTTWSRKWRQLIGCGHRCRNCLDAGHIIVTAREGEPSVIRLSKGVGGLNPQGETEGPNRIGLIHTFFLRGRIFCRLSDFKGRKWPRGQ